MFGAGLGGAIESVTTAVSLAGVGEYVGGLNKMGRAWGEVETAQSRAGRIGAGMEKLGAGLTVGVTGGEIALLTHSIKLGMDAVESDSLVATTFGQNTDKIIEWSKQRAAALGTNAYSQRRQAGEFQNQFLAGGIDPSKGAELSKTFVQMKDDFVSFRNIADPDVFRALQSGLAGEIEPMRRLGVFMTEATVKAYAYKAGIAATGEELTEQQKIQARAGFILQEFNKSKASGDLERTRDSPANRVRGLKNHLDEEMTNLGIASLPLLKDGLDIANKIVPKIHQAVEWFSKLDETTRKWVLGIGLGLGPLTMITGKVISLMAAMKTAKGVIAIEKAAGAALGSKSVAVMNVSAGVVNMKGGAGGGMPFGRPTGTGFPGSAPNAPELEKAGGLLGFLRQAVGPQFSIGGAGITGLRGATMGSAIGGAVVGGAAGYGARDDLKHLGYGEGAASGTALAAGLGAAALTAFNPPAGVLLAAATALRFGVDKFYNQPSERAAEGGSGADNAEIYGKDAAGNLKKALSEVDKGGDRRKVADQYSSLAAKARENGDETQGQAFDLEALTQRKIARKERTGGTPEFWEAQRKRSTEWLKTNGPQEGNGKQDNGKISNDDPHRRRTFFSRYLRSQTSEGTLSVQDARAMQTDFDKKAAEKAGKRGARADAGTPESRALAEMFGLGGKGKSKGAGDAIGDTGGLGEGGDSDSGLQSDYTMGPESMDGSNTLNLTINIPPRKADGDFRETKAGNNTPREPLI